MIDVSARVDLRELDAGFFRRFRSFANDLRPAFREMRKPVLGDLRDHRRAKSGPSGKWAPLAASTREKYAQMRRAGKKPPRGLLGKLPAANRTRMDRKRMVVESVVAWSLAHKRGLRAGRSQMPKRDAWWISRQLRRDCVAIVLRVAGKVYR